MEYAHQLCTEDYIPEETIFTWKHRPDASNCTTGRGGEIWCQITYTHDGGIQTVGWVSAHFLRSTITNTLLACLFQNSTTLNVWSVNTSPAVNR